MSGRYTSRSKHFDFIFIDLICVEVSFIIAYYVRLGQEKAVPGDYTMMNIIVILAHIAIAFFTECYSGIIRRGYGKEIRHVLVHNFELLAVLLAIWFFQKQSSDYSRILIALFVGIDSVLMYGARCLLKSYLRHHIKTEDKLSRVLVVTEKADADELLKGLTGVNYVSFAVQGVVIIDKNMVGQQIQDVDVVATGIDMYDYVRTNVIDEIFLNYGGKSLNHVVNKFLSMGVVVHVNLNGIITNVPNAVVERMNSYTVVTTSNNLMSAKQKIAKRLIDIFGSLVGIVITLLLFLIFGPAIKIQSKGSIFFKQVRVGKNGRKFKMYKFRSMYADAEERKKDLLDQNKMSGLMFKMDDDPRITPIGKFMRKWSLDEFPQFINVFKGDMSLVGTRPPTVDEYELYAGHHKSRLAMKPGVTGMWQVSGRNDITDFEEVVRLDNEYIKNFSITLDMKIIVRTIAAVATKKGSI